MKPFIPLIIILDFKNGQNIMTNETKSVRDTWKVINWKGLDHAAHSPDSRPSPYHLFVSMGHSLVKQRFASYVDVNKTVSCAIRVKRSRFAKA